MRGQPLVRLTQRDFDEARLSILRELTGFDGPAPNRTEDTSERPATDPVKGRMGPFLAGMATLARLS
jgi:hypothetical protein